MRHPGFVERLLSRGRFGPGIWIAVGILLAVGISTGIVTRGLWSHEPETIRLNDPGSAGVATPDGSRSVEGEAFPDVAVQTADGETVMTGSFVGRPLVVNFWYSSCPPCKKELPAFAEVSREFASTVRFIGVNPVDNAAAMSDFAAEHGVTYDNVLDAEGALLEVLGVVGFPTTVFVRGDGTIAEQHTGAMTADQLRASIEQDLGVR